MTRTRVVCRVRPRSPAEARHEGCVRVSGAEVRVDPPPSSSQPPTGTSGSLLSFVGGFDEVFGEDSTDEDVFERVAMPTIEDARRGYNGAVIAYGQSGAGKTHTMSGIVPRAIANLATHREAVEATGADCHLSLVVVELYQERLRDLLMAPTGNNTTAASSDVKVVEDKTRGVWMRGATEVNVREGVDVAALLSHAASRRAVGGTGLNADSSRSHLIVALCLEAVSDDGGSRTVSKLYLVDLAGCEKVARSGASGSRLDEACGINKSLSALGNVVAALTATSSAAAIGQTTSSQTSCAPPPSMSHIPYRDSKLTRVLQEALGGNSRTTLVVCVSPSAVNAAETVSTLRFGARAKTIVATSVCNVSDASRRGGGHLSAAAEAALRRELTDARAELAHLRDRAIELQRAHVFTAEEHAKTVAAVRAAVAAEKKTARESGAAAVNAFINLFCIEGVNGGRAEVVVAAVLWVTLSVLYSVVDMTVAA